MHAGSGRRLLPTTCSTKSRAGKPAGPSAPARARPPHDPHAAVISRRPRGRLRRLPKLQKPARQGPRIPASAYSLLPAYPVFLLGIPGLSTSPSRWMRPQAESHLVPSPDVFGNRIRVTLPHFLLPNKIPRGLSSRILARMSRFATGTRVLSARFPPVVHFFMYNGPPLCYGDYPNNGTRRAPA